jgi:hypothetical protein
MNQHMERRAAPVRRRTRWTLPRWAVQVAGATVLLMGAVVWTAGRSMADAAAGYRLPGALITAPSSNPAVNLSYLSRAVGMEEAQRLAPVTDQVAAVLARYARDKSVVHRAAQAVVAEGQKHNLDPALLVGLMIIENARIDPAARSNVGATGLMQVMPFHAGQWGCESRNLVNIEANICHGVNILASYIKGSPNLDRALLRYNGCVRGRNTPNCHTYPAKVKGWASHTTKMMTAVAQGGDVRSVALIPRINTPKAAPRRTARRVARRRLGRRGDFRSGESR